MFWDHTYLSGTVPLLTKVSLNRILPTPLSCPASLLYWIGVRCIKEPWGCMLRSWQISKINQIEITLYWAENKYIGCPRHTIVGPTSLRAHQSHREGFLQCPSANCRGTVKRLLLHFSIGFGLHDMFKVWRGCSRLSQFPLTETRCRCQNIALLPSWIPA